MVDANYVNIPIVPGSKVNRDLNRQTIDETHYTQLVGTLMYLTATRTDICLWFA